MRYTVVPYTKYSRRRRVHLGWLVVATQTTNSRTDNESTTNRGSFVAVLSRDNCSKLAERLRNQRVRDDPLACRGTMVYGIPGVYGIPKQSKYSFLSSSINLSTNRR